MRVGYLTLCTAGLSFLLGMYRALVRWMARLGVRSSFTRLHTTFELHAGLSHSAEPRAFEFSEHRRHHPRPPFRAPANLVRRRGESPDSPSVAAFHELPPFAASSARQASRISLERTGSGRSIIDTRNPTSALSVSGMSSSSHTNASICACVTRRASE